MKGSPYFNKKKYLQALKIFFRTQGKISFGPTSSLLDESFMLYTSSEAGEDTDQEPSNSSDLGLQLGLPPRPPSTRSKDKSFVSAPASPEVFSPTPSSGHFSGGSAVSKSPETQVGKHSIEKYFCL